MDASGSMARSGQSCVIPTRWPIPITPYAEELLSSFLCRAAKLHGLSPSRFCHFYLPGMPVWNRDIDRTPPPGLLKMVACQAGLESVERIKQTTLPASVTKPTGGIHTRTQQIMPWVTEVGIYHRLRTLHGQRFCPECIREQPYLLKHWRFSWCFCCTKHRILLHDACHQCGAVIAMHRAYVPFCCHECGIPLAQTATQVETSRMLIQFQIRLHEGQHRCIDNVGHYTWQFWEILSVTAQILRAVKQQHRDLPRRPEWLQEISSAAWCSRARVAESRVLVRFMHWLILNWPASFRSLAQAGHWTQKTFRYIRQTDCTRLKREWHKLPLGNTQRSAGRRITLRQRLNSLSVSQPPDWRLTRARLLWKAAQ
jgi:predicted RNA-binding Zn-ribbon protein involved in translation (DUF1610 family)